jgi:Flp pilus assembly protein TadG
MTTAITAARDADRRAGGSTRTDRGSVTVEMTLLAPVFLALLLFIVGLGRLGDARGQVTGAARDAARAASQTRDPAAARAAAQQTAQADLAGQTITCRRLTVNVDSASFAAGGTVAVTVACTADLADLTLSGLPGQHTLSSRAVAPLDRFRGVSP